MPGPTNTKMIHPGPPDETAKRRLNILADGRFCVVAIECESKEDARRMAEGAIETVTTKGSITFQFAEAGPAIWMPPSPRVRQ